MHPKKPSNGTLFRCVIIGENNLALECANLLLEKGHDILAIVSPFQSSNIWAKDRNIRHLCNIEELNEHIASIPPFDFLFSIVNRRILTDRLLTLPRKCAVNYHDALLPRYAGRFATSWALLKDEKQHGVTWHVMNAEIDEGKLLQQAPIEITENDTTLNLNLKCYEQALNSFNLLIERLAKGQLANIQLEQNLTQRNYYALHQKPESLGFIDWACSGKLIDRIFRSFNFGNYNNGFCSPKFIIQGKIYVITQHMLCTTLSGQSPGTIIQKNDNSLEIATKDYNILIKKAINCDGDILNPTSILEEKLAAIEPKKLHDIIEKSAPCHKYESFWIKELKSLHAWPDNPAPTEQKMIRLSPENVTLMSRLIKTTGKQSSNTISYSLILLVIWIIYLYRINDNKPITIYYSDSELRKANNDTLQLLSDIIPLNVTLESTTTFLQAIELVLKKVELLKQKMTFLNDIFVRYPEVFKDNKSSTNVPSATQTDSDDFSLMLKATPEKILTSDRLNTILHSLAEDIQAPITTINILNQDEKEKIYKAWNNTVIDFPSDQCIHQLFEQQVRETPNNIALIFEGEQLTYHDLNQRANQLAHYLRFIGVRAETIVGVCLERSFELLISILAIFKAGGAYTPLEPQTPTDRLAFILNETQSNIVITKDHLIQYFTEQRQTVVILDQFWMKRIEDKLKMTANELAKNPKPSNNPNSLAYVLYTSGSTGKPKGVMCEHIGLVNRITWMQCQFQLHASDRVLQKTPFSFDVSIWEFFWPLTTGATEVIAKPNAHKDFRELIDSIYTNHITVIHFVPSMLSVFLKNTNIKKCFSLRLVFSSGEVLKKSTQSSFYQKLSATLFNLYGPTEASIDVTYYPCRDSTDNFVPIGYPIANTQVYILDSLKQPTPIGIAGEIYIGGVGLARGYLNRAELNCEKFITLHHFPPDNSAYTRLYRTGDIGLQLPDGAIRYLGRIDEQIKLRGQRIEPAEIEKVILQENDIIEAAVVLVKSNRLVAYIILKNLVDSFDDQQLIRQDIKSTISKKIPAYMIPESFVFLKSYPLTSNGKLDKIALPDPITKPMSITTNCASTATPVERKIISLWQETLKHTSINLSDTFFHLGGNSLLAMELLSRVWEELHIDLSLVDLFSNDCLKDFICLASNKLENKNNLTSIEIPKREYPLALSFAQERLWILNQFTDQPEAYNIPLLIQLEGNLNITTLEMALENVVNHHEILRANFKKINGSLFQDINEKRKFPLEKVTVQNHTDTETIIKNTVNQPFDLSNDSLIKAHLLIQHNNSYQLLIVFHHIISDEISIKTLLNDLELAYKSLLFNKEVILPAQPIQYIEFLLWQKNLMKTSLAEQQAKYWKTQLDNFPEYLNLPTDKQRPEILSLKGKTYSLTLSKNTTDQINKFCKIHKITLFTLLSAALNCLLYQRTQQTDIIIGIPINERSKNEFKNLIGCFVNSIALRTKINPSKSFLDLLEMCKKTILSAYENQNLPFQNVIKALSIRRYLDRSPLFQVMLSIQSETLLLDLPEVKSKFLPCFTDTSKLDLTFYILEKSQQALLINIEYATDLFEEESIEKLALDFQKLLAEIPLMCDKTIKELNSMLLESSFIVSSS